MSDHIIPKLVEIRKDQSQRSVLSVLDKLRDNADNINDILVIYSKKKEDCLSSEDNGLSVQSCLFMLELFKHWLIDHTMVDKTTR